VALALLLYYLLIYRPDHLKDQVLVSVAYNAGNCTKQYPLLVIIQNESSKTVMKVEWNIGVYQHGYSTDLAGHSNYTSDKILKPGEKWQRCYTLPGDIASRVDQAGLEYRISYKYVTFE